MVWGCLNMTYNTYTLLWEVTGPIGLLTKAHWMCPILSLESMRLPE